MNASLSNLKTKTFYHALLLGSFALAASAMLATGAWQTGPVIELRQQEDLTRSLSQVVPAKLHDNDLLSEPVTLPLSTTEGAPLIRVYRATMDGEVTALAYKMQNDEGYSGRIVIVMGLKANGEVLGVRVLTHAETPGLGDKIEVAKSDWVLGFDGLSLANTPLTDWAVKKDGGRFDQFSGATITPRAVVKAVKAGLDFFNANKALLLAKPETPKKPNPKPEEAKP